jgi:hypothetical protein
MRPPVAQDFIESVLLSATDECIEWPYALTHNGYPQMMRRDNQRTVRVTIFVCEQVHGPRPAGRVDAAHSCGIRRCVNPRHLRWATRRENEADKLLHGTLRTGVRAPQAKLTQSQVDDARRRFAAGTVTQGQLAIEFKMNQAAISRMIRGMTYR